MVGPSKIKRESKRKNAAKKKVQHDANRRMKADLNKAADASQGKNPRPFPGQRA